MPLTACLPLRNVIRTTAIPRSKAFSSWPLKVLAYYEKWVSLEQMRVDCGVGRDGSKAKNLLRAARSYGLTVNTYRMSPVALREKAAYPCIIHWNMNHFAVLNGFRGNYAHINDPARGMTKVPQKEFNSAFTGVVLLLHPSENFIPGGKRGSTVAFAKKRLVGTGAANPRSPS